MEQTVQSITEAHGDMVTWSHDLFQCRDNMVTRIKYLSCWYDLDCRHKLMRIEILIKSIVFWKNY